MEKERPTYLNSDRTNPEFVDGINNTHADWDRIIGKYALRDTEIGTETIPSQLDSFIIKEAHRDANLADMLHSIERGEKFSRESRASFATQCDLDQRAYREIFATNIEAAKRYGAVNLFSLAGGSLLMESSYSQLEHREENRLITSARTGIRRAATPLFRDFASRRRPVKPSLEAREETVKNLAAASEFFTTMYLAGEAGDIPPEEAKKMAPLPGLILEYDALTTLIREEKNPYTWHFPAPLNMDVGPNNEFRADIVSVNTKPKEPAEISFVSVKNKKKNDQTYYYKSRNLRVISAEDMNLVDCPHDKCKIKGTHYGLVGQRVLDNTMNKQPRDPFTNEYVRAARSLAVIGVQLPVEFLGDDPVNRPGTNYGVV